MRLGPGQAFNTVPSFQSRSVNHATVQAVTPVTLFVVAREDLRQLVSTVPDLALVVLQDLADRLDHLTDLVEDLSLRTVRGRLARYLLEQAEAGVVTRRWTQDEIAAACLHLRPKKKDKVLFEEMRKDIKAGGFY